MFCAGNLFDTITYMELMTSCTEYCPCGFLVLIGLPESLLGINITQTKPQDSFKFVRVLLWPYVQK